MKCNLQFFGGRGSSSSASATNVTYRTDFNKKRNQEYVDKQKGLSKQYAQQAKDRNDEFFGEGNWYHSSNKYISYRHDVDKDTVIIDTMNIAKVDGKNVLAIASNKYIDIDRSQYMLTRNATRGTSEYAVKVQKNDFNVKTFNGSFLSQGYAFDTKEYTFAELKKIAKQQDKRQMSYKVK